MTEPHPIFNVATIIHLHLQAECEELHHHNAKAERMMHPIPGTDSREEFKRLCLTYMDEWDLPESLLDYTEVDVYSCITKFNDHMCRRKVQ